MRVAGYQMAVSRDVAANRDAIVSAIDSAVAQGAEVLLTPEGSLSGYTHEFDDDAVRDALAVVTERARSQRLGLALGTCFVEENGLCYNQVRFYERDGTHLGFHSKTLTCGSVGEDPPRGEVEQYAVTPLRTFELSGVRVGGLICNDFWANPLCTPGPDPHLTQQLASMEAQVIFHAVFGGRDGGDWSRHVFWPFHEANLRMRTRSAQLWTVTVDSATPVGMRCSAPSGVVNPQGEWYCRARDQGEELFVCDLALGD
ncbi:MAG: carbon-nitrogen hydrolase family protein [Candidatus Latescibacterota bacterium]|nr:carbon-nitrogen hydrolase family protein [Candidatus Latescibacterota bacterium]